MNENIKTLYIQFKKIRNMGWIETKRKGTCGIGYTFECLINKPEDNFPLPDFNGIEIKTGRKYSRRDIHLFCATPDGDFLFPIERVIYYLGYPDKKNHNVKIFNKGFNSIEYIKIGLFKEAKIKVNRNERKVEFIARKIDGLPFKMGTSWSFDMLEQKINLKLKYLARIIADSKIINGTEYFHYNYIKFYKLKNFETFISLMENGYISVNFNIGVFRNGKKKDKIHDRGVSFKINEKYINLLYDEIKIYF